MRSTTSNLVEWNFKNVAHKKTEMKWLLSRTVNSPELKSRRISSKFDHSDVVSFCLLFSRRNPFSSDVIFFANEIESAEQSSLVGIQ